MKKIVFLGMSLFNSLSFTALASPPRPATLDCMAPDANAAARHFHLTRFDSNEPRTDLDAKADGVPQDTGEVIEFCANNGCDNNYCFLFFSHELKLAAQGKKKTVNGLMNYFNSDSILTPENAESGDSVAFSCKVVQ
jgi:hypothetical protein